jgi:predicted flap endonuclease-1-like 5' DNA nuclease
VPLHSVAQLLLTAGQASRPEGFDHAVQAMALAGALMLQQDGSTAEVRVAMLAGLLHDLGEMYIDPRYGEADADRNLDFLSYQQLVVHPHVGHLLIAQLTNYPGSVSRAITEHHERLDGSGYPHGLRRDAVSPLGRLLAVAEGTLGALRGERPHLSRASVALRVVPSEFDLGWVGLVEQAARAQPARRSAHGADEVRLRLGLLDVALQAAEARAAALLPLAESSDLKGALELSRHLLSRLRTGWNASGLWSPEEVAAQDAAEVECVEDELSYRLRAVERAAQLRAGELAPHDAKLLEQLCVELRSLNP